MERDGEHFDWNHARAFLATAECGSLSAAAVRLGTTQPTVGRQVANLERSLGTVLFERVGRGLVLTAAGERLLAAVRSMGRAADEVLLAASGEQSELTGRVTISASELFCAVTLPSVLRTLRERAPRLQLEVAAVNTLSDLLRREADVAVRHVEPTEDDLICRRVADRRARLYRARGRSPTAPERFIGMTGDAASSARQWSQMLQRDVPETSIHCTVASGFVMREFIAGGLGTGVLPEVMGDDDPRLERQAGEVEPLMFSTWIVTHRALHRSARIRLVFDTLVEMLDLP